MATFLQLEKGRTVDAMTLAHGELVLVIHNSLYRVDLTSSVRKLRFWFGPLPEIQFGVGNLIFYEAASNFYACDQGRLVRFPLSNPKEVTTLVVGPVWSCAIDNESQILYYSARDTIFKLHIGSIVAAVEFCRLPPLGTNRLSLLSRPSGTLLVADKMRHSLWMITPDGKRSLLAGGGESAATGLVDGPGPTARFNFPMGMGERLSDQRVFICDAGNDRIRVLGANGAVCTAGTHNSRLVATRATMLVVQPRLLIFYSASTNAEIGFVSVDTLSFEDVVCRNVAGDQTVDITNGQSSVNIVSSFLGHKCPEIRDNPKLPPWVDQTTLDTFVGLITSNFSLDWPETAQVLRLALLASIYKLPLVEHDAICVLQNRLRWEVKDCNQAAAFLFSLVKLDPIFYHTKVGQMLREQFIYSYYNSPSQNRPSAREVIANLEAVDPQLLDDHLLPNSSPPTAPLSPLPPTNTTPTNEEVLEALYKTREATGDFEIVSWQAESDPATNGATGSKYRFHSFVFRYFWPYFSNLALSSMREASERELNLSSGVDGGLTFPALEAIGELLYTEKMSEATQNQLSPVDLISISGNAGLYEFGTIPRLEPLMKIATALEINTECCVEYLQIATELKIDNLAQQAETFIVANFPQVWALPSNRDRLLSFSDSKTKELVFSLLAKSLSK